MNRLDQTPNYRDIFLTRDEMRAAMQSAMDWALACLEPPDDNFMPKLIAHCRSKPGEQVKQVACMLAIPFNEHEEKHGYLVRLGEKFYRDMTFPMFTILLSEAWLAVEKEGDKHVQPRDNPNRQEVIIAMGLSMEIEGGDQKAKGGKQICMQAHLPITRDGENKIVPGKFSEIGETGNSSALLRTFYRGFFKDLVERMN